MAALNPDQLREANTINAELAELNSLLDRAGRIADTLTNRGYEVTMNLWHDTRGSETIKGRLQGNVAKAALRTTERN